MAALTDDGDLKKVLLDIAREEKTHVGEFQTMLRRFDAEQVKEMEHAKKEIKELTGEVDAVAAPGNPAGSPGEPEDFFPAGLP